MLDEDANSSLLRLFHCFLHCAPQAVMQLVFLLSFVMNPQTKSSINLGEISCMKRLNWSQPFDLHDSRFIDNSSMDSVHFGHVNCLVPNVLSQISAIRSGRQRQDQMDWAACSLLLAADERV